jgi:hypothetical protein
MARKRPGEFSDPDGEWLVHAYLIASECVVDTFVSQMPVQIGIEEIKFLKEVRELALEAEPNFDWLAGSIAVRAVEENLQLCG